MSWGVNIIGKPAAVAAELDRVSAELQGESKAEFDAALPGLKSLVLENRVTEAGAAHGYVEPAVFLEASGHGTSGLSRVCSASVKSIYARIVAVLVAVLCLASCAGLTPSALSPSTAGAPATAGQLAQTVSGQQGQAPATAVGGTSTIVWNFASSVPSETSSKILAIAAEQKWTAEQLTEAMRAAAGAPQTVNITTQTNSANGGNASSIPAGTGGGTGVGGAGTITKP